jgi:hypothetical protein
MLADTRPRRKMRCPGRMIRNGRGTVTGDMGHARLACGNNVIQPPETQPPTVAEPSQTPPNPQHAEGKVPAPRRSCWNLPNS